MFNLFVFALFVTPPVHRWVDRGFVALASINLEEPVGISLQVWLVVSTIAVTILLGRLIWQERCATSADLASESLRLETLLVIAWWLVVFGACAYAFMLGMGS